MTAEGSPIRKSLSLERFFLTKRKLLLIFSSYRIPRQNKGRDLFAVPAFLNHLS